MELETIQRLAAATDSPRWQGSVKHTARYLRVALPELHAQLAAMGLDLPAPKLSNIVSDNALYAAWNDIFAAATGAPFAPSAPDVAPAKAVKLQPTPAAAIPPKSPPPALPSLAPVASATPPAAAIPTMDLAALTAIHGVVFGHAATHERLANRTAQISGAGEKLHAAWAKADEARNAHGLNSPAAKRAEADADKIADWIRAEQRGDEAAQCNRLLADFMAAGLVVPGADMRGVKCKINLRAPTAGVMSKSELAHAQSSISDFCAAISGDITALRGESGACHAARQFLIRSGRTQLGNIEI